MNLNAPILKRKLTTLFLITASVAAFAALGDGGGKRNNIQKRSLLSYKPAYDYKSFSLKTGFNYRGTNIFSQNKTEGKYIQLNNVITYQKGNTTYILPMKKKLLLDKIKFNPAPVRP